MSLYAVYTGIWVNWSHGLFRGATVTLSARDGGLLLSFIAAFITIVSSQLWKIIAFTGHQLLVKRGEQDGLHFQQRNVLRNVTSPAGAAWLFLLQAWYWRGRVTMSFFRTMPVALFAMAYLVIFGLLAVFSSQVSKGEGNERLIRGQQCGYWKPLTPVSSTTVRALSQKSAQDARIATAYARACYGASEAPPQCDILPQSTLAYTNRTQVACPFDDSMCKNGTAFSMKTRALSSHTDLGINAAPSDRIEYHKEMTCAPVTLQGYVAYLTGEEAEEMGYDNSTLIKYSYGVNRGVSNWTYLYNTDAFYANVGYTTSISTWYRNDNTSLWTPVPELQPDQGDLDMLFIAFNSIGFSQPCDDPIFSAHKPFVVSSKTGGLNTTYYHPDRYVSPMACVTKHQFCNPNSGDCTDAVSADRLTYEAPTLNLTYPQLTAAYRILLSLQFTDFNQNVGPRMANALRAQDVVSETDQLYLPSNQWEIEASGWFEDSLARLQFAVQEYAAGPSVIVEGSRLVQPWDPSSSPAWNESDTLAAPSWKSQCLNQRTRDAQGTVSFSILGLAVIFAVGGLILLISVCLETVVGWIQRMLRSGEYQRLAWILDNNLQMQRMLYESLGLGFWHGQTDSVPTTAKKQVFSSFDPFVGARAPSQMVGESSVYTEKEAGAQVRPLLYGEGDRPSQ